MTYAVTLTRKAQEDLGDIYAYIAFQLLSPLNAARQLGRIEEAILKLETYPGKFRLFDREPWHSRGLRIMPVDHFVVLYLVEETPPQVTVVRVMYGGRKYSSGTPG